VSDRRVLRWCGGWWAGIALLLTLWPTSVQARDLLTEGDTVGGWRVVRVVSHSEFRRVFLTDATGQETGVEITLKREGGTATVLVQPAPGQRPPTPLLEAVRALLDKPASNVGEQRPSAQELFQAEPDRTLSNFSIAAGFVLLALAALLLFLRLRGPPATALSADALPWRPTLLVTLAAFLLMWGYLQLTSIPAPLNRDTIRDILMGQQCHAAGWCHMGPQSSLGGLVQGTLWPRLAGSGLSITALQTTVHALEALGVALIVLAGARWLSLTVGVVAAAFFASGILWTRPDLPILWHPILMPLMAGAATASLVWLTRNRHLEAGVVAAVALGLSLEAHPVAAGLIPAWAAAVILWCRRPWTTLAAGALALGAMVLWLSPGTAVNNLSAVAGLSTPVWMGLVFMGGAVLSGLLRLRRRFAARLAALPPAHGVALVLGLLVAAQLLVVLAGLVIGHQLVARYHVQALPALSLLAALGLAKVLPAHGRPLGAAAIVLVALVGAAGASTIDYEGWHLEDAQRMGRELAASGYSHDILYTQLQGSDGQRLVAGMALVSEASTTDVRPPAGDILVVRTPRSRMPTPPPSDWRVVPLVDSDDVAVIRVRASRLASASSQVCVQTSAGRECLSGRRDPSRLQGPRSRLAYPTVRLPATPDTAYELRWEFPVTPGDPRLLSFGMHELAADCPWEMQLADGAAVHRPGDRPLPLGPEGGTLVLRSRRNVEGCQVAPIPWPPDLVEIGAGERELLQLPVVQAP